MLARLRFMPLALRSLSLLLVFTLYACGSPAGGPGTSTGADTVSFPTATPSTNTGSGGSSTPLPSSETPADQAPPSQVDNSGAVMVLVDYYRAINARQYQKAYDSMIQGSGLGAQTFATFRNGFGHTVTDYVRVASPTATRRAAGSRFVDFPVVVTATDDKMNVHHFAGTYVLGTPEGSAKPSWKIYSATMREISAGAPLDGDVFNDGASTVRQYYEDIRRRDFPAAYTLWDGIGSNSGQSYQEFIRGFAETAEVEIRMGKITSEAGAGQFWTNVPLLVRATNSDGSKRTFCGSYVVHHPNLYGEQKVPFRLSKGSLTTVKDVDLQSNAAERLLADCAK